MANAIDKSIEDKLKIESNGCIESTKNKILEENNKFFKDEQEKLQKWADDIVKVSEKELDDIKNQIREVNRKIKNATNAPEQMELQKKLTELEKQKRHKRQNIFDVEDEIDLKRKEMIAGLEKRILQKIEQEILFIIEWEII